MDFSRRDFLAGVPAATIAAAASQSNAAAQEQQVTLAIPQDGGTPRDPGRIQRLGPSEFRILASVEEGRSPLGHAVSRVDLVVANSGPECDVVLHLELSGDGARTDFNKSQFGGMPERDYVYIQPPGELWRRVQGSTEGWVATVRFPARRGETKVGLSPWYTYSDYLTFVTSFPSHPHLSKTMIGKSDQGREHWELTITDPAVPRESKRSILWHAREHSYESFSSPAVEGLVAWLLSPAAEKYRREYVFSIQPMVNVDGVGSGYEYRGGYDFPDPRKTASGRITFESVDRIRPQFVIAWHNWIAPRSLDVVFFTHGENGRPSRHAWDLFTQRFPSPRNVGHQWDSQRNPNAKNWYGRKGLSDNNIHQYAMKHYDTSVWGWEMPWWNRDEEDPLAFARRMGADFARAFLETLSELKSGTTQVSESATVQTRSREMYEFALRGRSHVDNPYRDAALVGEFVSPTGKMISAEGFHCGDDSWKLRFVPEEEGEYRYVLRGEGASLFAQGRLIAVPPRERGFISIHPKNPYAFAYEDGSPFFPMGDTCYGLHDDSTVTPELRSKYLEQRRSQRFNFVRMSIGHSAKRAAEDRRYWAWGGTAEQPDLDRINPEFFDSLDEVLREMAERGMNADLLLLNFYRRPFTDPKLWTSSRERIWLRYVVARCASYRNIFLWTLSNEYETHPDGKYRLDRPGDVEWVKATAKMVRQLDPYGHPITVHPVVSSSSRGPSPRDEFDTPWRIGGLFGEGGAIDVLSQQTSSVYRSRWDDRKQCWTGNAAGIERSIAADRIYGKPVLNTENGYEYLPGYPTNRRQVFHTDHVRMASWRIVCAGGYFAAGFISTLAHGDVWDAIDPPHRHPFLVQDAGAGAQLAMLYDFFERLPYWGMGPRPERLRGNGLCLAAEGEAYVVYLPHGGRCRLVPERIADAELAYQWFNPRQGGFQGTASPLASDQELIAPDDADWVLLVQPRKAEPA
ncbi:MAG TPA: DUF4038 domain-containing protein [Bryobacteraceae bacterium]|nr:DUF4038 domain-containing protein [Bryobacteraceae bacterium]